MAVLKTYIGAVKPVGEKIVFNYARTATTVVDDDFDFLIDQDYYVIGMSMTKTNASLQNLNNVLTSTLIRIPTSGVQLGAGVAAQCALKGSNAGVLGQTCVAGVPVPAAGPVGAVTVVVPVVAPVAEGTTLSSWLDPTIVVRANAPTTGTGNSRQRIRLKIKSDITGAAFNPSCLIVIELAKYSYGISQGAVSNSNQNGEVLSPVV